MVVLPYKSESKSYIHIGEGHGCLNDEKDNHYIVDYYHNLLVFLLLLQKALLLK